jgi:peptidylprolyl isomerase
MLRRLTLALPLAFVLFAACGDDDSTSPSFADPATATYAPALGIDIGAMTKTASGLYYQDVTVGTGVMAQSGQTVTIHYTGWLVDGTEFDTSRDGAPYTGPVNGFIPGFTEGIIGMRVGGRRKLVIPPQLAYGIGGSQQIPGNAILVFDVELVNVQ